MQRGNAAGFFNNQQKLITEAKVQANFLSGGHPIASIPMEVLRLGALHRKILRFDRDRLKKHASELGFAQKELVQAIDAYLDLNEFSEDVLGKFASSTYEEAKHLCEAVKFAIARKAYAAEARIYLRNLLDDIKTTDWQEASTSGSDEDSDEMNIRHSTSLRQEWAMPWQIKVIQLDLEDAEKKMKSDTDVVVMMEKARNAIDKIRHQYDAHTDAAAFCRQHLDELSALSYPANQYTKIKINY